MEGSVSIAELCAEHALLAAELVDLDRRIQALSRASLTGTRYNATTRSADASIAKADILWLQLNNILSRQNAVVVSLIDQAAGNTGELRDKGQILATLLRTNKPTEGDLAQALSLSLVGDIITLFPQHDSAVPHLGAARPRRPQQGAASEH
jgi:hypothetical protein